ncbi:efflux RND transporter periplasmic adaptor subunit [Skermanella stibiiresistens]|uniref:efflux RND transporter periplasmic adaptor subunit n=1 Tax=Skermanella stibiiresistens TaxID=913326 RepID=UPI000687BA51|nr:efflux RND transporter periplasmic adaptor subunit [Skermanella stibiiresistens]
MNRWFASSLAAAFLMTAFPATAQPTDSGDRGGLGGGLGGVPEIRAQISPRRSTMLSSEIGAKIDDLSLREGERFKEGQKLVGFDCAVHRARLNKAFAQQQAARKLYDVNSKLDKLGSVSTLELEAAAAQLSAAEAETAMMRTMVERCVVLAPFPGRIAELRVRRYEFVGEGKELMEILDDRELEVEMIVPSRWLAWLVPGTSFKVLIEETGHDYVAEVTRLSARIDPVSQSIKVFGKVVGTQRDLLAGMSGRAVFAVPN